MNMCMFLHSCRMTGAILTKFVTHTTYNLGKQKHCESKILYKCCEKG